MFKHKLSEIQENVRNYDKPLRGIIEYIQVEGNLTIPAFFGTKTKINQEDIDNVIFSINEKLKEIKKIKKSLNEIEMSQVERNFLLSQLNIIGLKYIYLKKSVYFEAEKLGFNIDEINFNKDLAMKHINKLQDIVYGPEISSIPSEVDAVLIEMATRLQNNKDKITLEEYQYIASFIDSFDEKYRGMNYTEAKTKNPLKEKYISREKFEQIFNLVFDIYGLDGRQLDIKKIGNFSVDSLNKKVICPEDKIQTTDLLKLLQLIDHEIGVHVIRGYNTDKTIGIPSEGYVETEEGMAKVAESLFQSNLEDVDKKPALGFILTFIAEQLNYEESEKLFYILYKLNGNSEEKSRINAKDSAMRKKRFVDTKQKGTNRKDVSYTRGKTMLVDYLTSLSKDEFNSFMKDFYFSKLSKDNISLVGELKESLGIDQNELKYPLWIGKIIFKKLMGEHITLKSLQENDPRFGAIESLTMGTKRKIVQILGLLDEYKVK